MGYFLLFWLLLLFILSIPAVQTKLGKLVTERLNKDFGTDMVVQKINLSFFGDIGLKGVQIKDHKKDTLIFVNTLSTSLLNAKRVLDKKVNLGAVSLNGVQFYMKTYKGETDDSMAVFLESFENENDAPAATPFILQTDKIYIENLTYKLVDENKETPIQFAAKNAGGTLQNFKLEGPNVFTQINGLYLIDNNGLNITNLTTHFTYTKKQIALKNTTLQTINNTLLKADIVFNYKRKDFQYFTDKVKIKAICKKGTQVAVQDLKKFYKELHGDDMLSVTGEIDGTVNNFSANKVVIHSKKGLKVIGNMAFVNAMNLQRGFIFDATLSNVTASYQQLKSILPSVLGKTLPTNFRKLGVFTLAGVTLITPQQMSATLTVNSRIGTISSDLQLANIANIDNAEYEGEVEFKNFDIGLFANDSILGKVSLKADVKGSGFLIDKMTANLIGNVSQLEFKNYNYKNLDVNGQFKKKKFDGILIAKDPNLQMKFEGLADFAAPVNKFDFKAAITKVDLKQTNLFTRDSLSVLKGEIILDVEGNNFDDIIGKATFTNINYTNQKRSYPFKKFNITSSIKDSIKTIKVISKDIVNGELTGKFTFDEVSLLTQNALGSIYTNYTPYAINSNQFLNFDFTIYNQIVDVFFPKISVGKNTKIKGKINSNKKSFRLTFSSPKIDAYGNIIDNILLRMDTKNPLYNTHLTADNILTKYYTIHKLNLLNRTENDTLFFKSVFKGGKQKTEKFNLDFYYTINNLQKSVLGIQKSTFNYKDYVWTVNPNKNNESKVTFDLKTKDFIFNPFEFVSTNQKIAFQGALKGDTYKDLQAKFSQVKLASFLPPVDSLVLNGKLNGRINFKQVDGIYNPKGNLVVNDFYINNFPQGNLLMQVAGEDSYEKLSVNLSLNNNKAKNITATGYVDFTKQRPAIDLRVLLKEYQIAAFSPLGEDVLSKLRGSVSGNFTATGSLRNPDFDGALHIENAGLTFPYLNIDFDLKGNTTVQLEGQSFILNNVILEDTKYTTKGLLRGYIAHQNFEQWFLNLDINSKGLLVLDTYEEEESSYYGTGFLNGEARIRGLTNNLTIDVNGKTNPGTVFVIPLSDVKTIDNFKLITFKTDKKEETKNTDIEDIKGLNLNINLNVTKDAVAKVVIDKVAGSELKGSGEGNLEIEINTRGKFNIYGDFEVDKGIYNFKYGGIITKPFIVQKGGTISWNGNPYDAELNLTAVYRTKANPAQLLENLQTSRNIPVDLYTRITGDLFNSQQEFDIKIPNANSAIASELEFVLNDNDKNAKMLQFASLLATNSFFNSDNLANNASAGIAGTASDLLGSVLSSIINSKDGKFKVGVGYTQGDRTNVNRLTDSQVDLSVSTQISDRVLVNGKVGIPIGANTQTSVAGDLTVEVLLTEQGNLRGTVFNRQNEVQYSLEEEGYTQGVGLTYQVNFDTGKELFEKIGLRKKKKDTINVKKDTLITTKRKLINFKR